MGDIISLIEPEHLKIECDRHPPGGQHCGVLSGVTMTHLPTGISVHVDIERSQHRNRQIAEDAILGALTSPYMR